MMHYWTDEEEELVRKYYPIHGSVWEGWASVLPDRTPGSIGQKAGFLGLHVLKDPSSSFELIDGGAACARWTDEEIAKLRTHYPVRGYSWAGWREVLPTRTAKAIRDKAEHLGLHKLPTDADGTWSAAKDTLLLKTIVKLSEALGKRPDECVERLGDLYARAIMQREAVNA